MIGRPNMPGSAMRRMVSWKVECRPNSGRNCFGRPSREAGHRRVPAPPHMIRGMMGRANSRPQKLAPADAKPRRPRAAAKLISQVAAGSIRRPSCQMRSRRCVNRRSRACTHEVGRINSAFRQCLLGSRRASNEPFLDARDVPIPDQSAVAIFVLLLRASLFFAKKNLTRHVENCDVM